MLRAEETVLSVAPPDHQDVSLGLLQLLVVLLLLLLFLLLPLHTCSKKEV